MPAQSRPWRAILAVSAGNALEWYDFVIYGYFALPIGKHFFPTDNQAASILLVFASFGVAFLMRPLGAVVIGNYADRHGRKPALTLTIALMMAGTAIIAFAPGYASIGLAAPALIVGGRILQGISAGGEFGSATAFLAEQNPHRRGFFASWQFASQALAAALATCSGLILTSVLSDEQLNDWGWRAPFVVGLLIGPVAFYIRRRIDESHEFQTTAISAAPLRDVVAHAKARLLLALGAVVVLTVATYTLVFMPTYAVQQLGLPFAAGFTAGLLTSVLQMVLVPIAGAVSDRCGRLPIAGAAAALILLASYPLFAWLTAAPTAGSLLAFQLLIGALVAGYAGALPALLSELFPTAMRTTGISISYAVAVAAFGGLAPFINASLIEITGSKLAPSFYLMLAAALTLAALVAVARRGLK